MSEQVNCKLCGEPMPEGEDMFFYHGYSGPCPKPPLPKVEPEPKLYTEADLRRAREESESNAAKHILHGATDGCVCEPCISARKLIEEATVAAAGAQQAADAAVCDAQYGNGDSAHDASWAIRNAPLVTSDEGAEWLRKHDAGVRFAEAQWWTNRGSMALSRTERDHYNRLKAEAPSTGTPARESREEKAARLIKQSGKEVHASDCATSVAPAEEPGPCDCSTGTPAGTP